MRSIRFSLAGLMGGVLAAAIGFAALRNPSQNWAGVVLLVTLGALGIAMVGAFCRSAARRGGFLGFAVFGWIYIIAAFHPLGIWPKLPTQSLLELLAPRIAGIDGPFPAFGRMDGMGGMGGGMGGAGMRSISASGSNAEEAGGFGAPAGGMVPATPGGPAASAFCQIGHCLFALLAATLGAFLGNRLFVAAVDKQEEVTSGRAATLNTRSRNRWLVPLAQLISGVTLVAVIASGGTILKPEVWAGAAFFLTWCLIGLMAMGALIAQGRHRESWLGAAFFGAGFLVLTFGRMGDDTWPGPPTVEFLNEIRPRLPAFASGLKAMPESITAANARILAALNRRVPLHFLEETPLEDVLILLKKETAGADGKGIPVYVDPIGLSEADRTMTSTVRSIELDGVPLRASLPLCLKQLDLACTVKDGFLQITSQESLDTTLRSHSADAFQVVGHCVLALFAAGIGGLAAPFVCGLARRPAE
jgi:hypothetical protein